MQKKTKKHQQTLERSLRSAPPFKNSVTCRIVLFIFHGLAQFSVRFENSKKAMIFIPISAISLQVH